MNRPVTLWLAMLAALGVLGGMWRWHAASPEPVRGVLIAGGDGGGLPRSTPSAEGFEVSAFERATAGALRQGGSALLVMRHGHLIYEQYARGGEASDLIDGGELSRGLLFVAAGVAASQHGMELPSPPLDSERTEAAIALASGRSYPDFLSRHVWQPLHAAPAYWTAPTVKARSMDWLRVGELLLNDGRFEGTQIVQPGWLARNSAVLSGPGAAASPTALLTLTGPGSTRLWLAPRLDLAILRVGEAPPPGAAVDEDLARVIIDTLVKQPGSGGSRLNDLVPGH